MRTVTRGLLLILAFAMLTMGVWGQGKKIKIGVSLPTQEVERWVRDKDNLIKFGQAAGCDVLMQIANNDPVRQNNQVENLISQKIDVLIIAPHDADAAATAVAAAKKAGIPVVGYVRLILGADLDAHVSDDFVRTGELQVSTC